MVLHHQTQPAPSRVVVGFARSLAVAVPTPACRQYFLKGALGKARQVGKVKVGFGRSPRHVSRRILSRNGKRLQVLLLGPSAAVTAACPAHVLSLANNAVARGRLRFVTGRVPSRPSGMTSA